MISSIRWLQEPEDVRAKLIEKFKIQKSGGRSVENNKLISDGISGEELYAKLNVKALQEFTSLESTDVYELFAVAVELAKTELPNYEKPIREKDAPAARPADGSDASPATAAKSRRGRVKKESKG